MNPEQRVEILRAACCVAGIDGETSPNEKKLIDKLARGVGCGTASVEAMVARAKRDPNFYQQQFKVLKEDPKETLVELIQVAMADGVVSEVERDVLKKIAANLNLSEDVFDQLMVKVGEILAKRSSQNDG